MLFVRRLEGGFWQEELDSIAEYLSKVDARDHSKEEARVSTPSCPAQSLAATRPARQPLTRCEW
jgi:hypothetical protein